MLRLVLTILVLSSSNLSVKCYDTTEQDTFDDYDIYPQFGLKDFSSEERLPNYPSSTNKPAFLPTVPSSSFNTNDFRVEKRPSNVFRQITTTTTTTTTTTEAPRSTTVISLRKRRPYLRRRNNVTRTTSSPIRTNLNQQKENQPQLNDSILSSASVPQSVSTQLNVQDDFSLQNIHNVNYGPFGPTALLPATESKSLFSTDIQTPKFKIDESGFGFFKIPHEYNTKVKTPLATRPPLPPPKQPPLDLNLKTDLAVANLPLQTYPHSLDPDSSYKRQNSPNIYNDHGFSAASKNQIGVYNEDVRLKYDNAIERYLLNSANPADKAKYYQFLKAKEDEKFERQNTHIKEPHRRRPVAFKIRPANNQATHYHFKIKAVERPIAQGIRFFSKTPPQIIDRSTQHSYRYPFI